MTYALLKQTAKTFRLYPQLRQLRRHLTPPLQQAFRAECDLYRTFISPGDLVFDIGANFGDKTEVFSAIGARVVAVEPQPDCAAEVRARSHATVIEAAVGDRAADVSLYIDEHRTGSSLLPEWEGNESQSIQVAMITLDDLIARFGLPRFCKIDVEGYERHVISGLSQPIAGMSFEFHRHRLDEARACLDALRRFGFTACNVTCEEEHAFALPAWITLDALDRLFADNLPLSRDCGWGDVFLRHQ